MFRPDLGGDCSESSHRIPLLPRPAPARDVRVVEVVGLCHQTTLCPSSWLWQANWFRLSEKINRIVEFQNCWKAGVDIRKEENYAIKVLALVYPQLSFKKIVGMDIGYCIGLNTYIVFISVSKCFFMVCEGFSSQKFGIVCDSIWHDVICSQNKQVAGWAPDHSLYWPSVLVTSPHFIFVGNHALGRGQDVL